MPSPARLLALALAALGASALAAPARAAIPEPPPATTLAAGWEVSVPGSNVWRPAAVPAVFDPRPDPALFPGTVRTFRLRFTGPPTPPGFGWRLEFGGVRRVATVWLNGRLLGRNGAPFTPFGLSAEGLRPGALNELVVEVDNRVPWSLEGWWNWGGIVRPVRLVPVGSVAVPDLGLLTRVRCARGPRRCRAGLLLRGTVRRRGARRAELSLRLRSPGGRVTRRKFPLGARRRLRLFAPVAAPVLWSPRRPALYSATVVLRAGGRRQQVVRRRVGLRSVSVRRGRLRLNGRPLRLRGASIHEDLPGRGAALTETDMDGIVADLEALRANVTRAHYPLDERLLSRLDRAGIMVWNQAPVWHRDAHVDRLATPTQRRGALGEVGRTVLAGRSHPSVIAHSVANELSPRPDVRRNTGRFLVRAARVARRLDPTLPVAVDIVGRTPFGKQRTYRHFDALGINQYFGWYPRAGPLGRLARYLRHTRARYRRQALVVTEFGAEAPPELADGPAGEKGTYAFQAAHAERTLRVIDRLPFLSGAIYWTLREFVAYPGWTGGVPADRRRGPPPNTMHNKGLITYQGQRKPAFELVRRRYAATPLYGRGRR